MRMRKKDVDDARRSEKGNSQPVIKEDRHKIQPGTSTRGTPTRMKQAHQEEQKRQENTTEQGRVDLTEAAARRAKLRRGAQAGRKGMRTYLMSVAAQTQKTDIILNLTTDGATPRRRKRRRILRTQV